MVSSWILRKKFCSDGVSVDLRPEPPHQLEIESLNHNLPDGFSPVVITPKIAILKTQPVEIKITLYRSGRMLVETREMEKAVDIARQLLHKFGVEIEDEGQANEH